MADDELSAPLGQNAKKEAAGASSCRSAFRMSIAGVLGLFVLRLRGLGADGRRSARRRACRGGRDRLRSAEVGRPCRRSCRRGADARPAQLRRPGHARAEADAGPPPAAAQPASAAAAPPPNTKTVTIIDGSTGKRQEVAIPASRDVRAPLEQRLLETSRHGAHPAHRARRRAAVRSLCPRREAAAGPQGWPADRDRDRRARRQRQRHPAGDAETARRR